MSEQEIYETFETGQPWITWTYLHPDWWTRVFGKTQVEAVCCICGHRETITVRMPRFGPVSAPAGGRHPTRVKFCSEHVHRLQQQAPETWVLPLRNPAALSGRDIMDVLRDVAEKAARNDS
jgi:hypothetical protein